VSARTYLYFTGRTRLGGSFATVNRNNGSEELLLRYCRLGLLSTWSCVAQDGKLKHGVDFVVREL
jgi:hypothetical protein